MPAAWWSLLLVGGIPVVAWESGTAYIDAAHGLFAGLALLYAADAAKRTEWAEQKPFVIAAGLCLGLTLGTKYTGLQVMAGIGLAWIISAVLSKSVKIAVKPALTALALAALVAIPWYAKTTIYTGNPVYPFFYQQLGGEGWDEWRSEIYTEEQKTFGVGSEPANLGHAVLGLAYQPGRYVNPRQTEGGGFPTGAIGFAVLLGGLLAAAAGGIDRRTRFVLGGVGIGLIFWFLLSQQSRYLAILAVPLAVVAAGAITKEKLIGKFVAAGAVLQAGYTIWMLWTIQASLKLDVALGIIDQVEYQRAFIPFMKAAERINDLPEGSKVALYDEVLGFPLDTEYMWANPGHSMIIPYPELSTGPEYVRAMKDLGFTHVYFNLGYSSKEHADAWSTALQLGSPPYARPAQKEEMAAHLNLKWRWLLGDAHAERAMRFEFAEGSGLLFSLQ